VLIKVRKHTVALLAGATALAMLMIVLSPTAQAQSMNASSSSFNAGYGRAAGSENQGVNYSTRDAQGNRVIIDGVMQTGEDQSVYSSSTSGAWDSYAGVGGRYANGSASAIGNNLTVITQGNYNTVIVNSNQTNNGAVTAGANVGGGVGNSNDN
jgi:holdfast attachment protein HfaA